MKKQNFQLIIPMAGIGERFKKLGFSIPKALIKIKDQPLLSFIDAQFGVPQNKLFICNVEHLQNDTFQMQSSINKFAPGSSIAGISPHKLGPVFSLISAEDQIIDDLPVLVSYCDCLSVFDMQLFQKEISNDHVDGIIFIYDGFHPSKIRSLYHAYIQEENGYVIDVKEKESFTNKPYLEKASSGIYYFSSGKILKDLCQNAYKNNISINGEFFVSLLFKELIKNGKKIKSFRVEKFINWGTPEDFLDYLEILKFHIFKKEFDNRNQINDINNFSCIEDVENFKKRFKKYQLYDKEHLDRDTVQDINNYWMPYIKKFCPI